MKKGLKAGLLILVLIITAGVAAGVRYLWANNTAVSIIGGADGPTSIFIAGKIRNDSAIYMAAGFILTAAAILGMIAVKRRNKGRRPEEKKNEN